MFSLNRFWQRNTYFSNDCIESVFPYAIELVFVEFSISNRVSDVPVPQVVLDAPYIGLAHVGQMVAAGMPEHMGVDRNLQAGTSSGPGDHLVNRRMPQTFPAATCEDIRGSVGLLAP